MSTTLSLLFKLFELSCKYNYTSCMVPIVLCLSWGTCSYSFVSVPGWFLYLCVCLSWGDFSSFVSVLGWFQQLYVRPGVVPAFSCLSWGGNKQDVFHSGGITNIYVHFLDLTVWSSRFTDIDQCYL